jgi:hypothetical protein
MRVMFVWYVALSIYFSAYMFFNNTMELIAHNLDHRAKDNFNEIFSAMRA